MRTPIITFTSDFGLDDWFVGVVHGVLHDTCPEAHVVDLTHSIEPGDVHHAAFVLEAAAPDFPQGTVHLAVVDPGVGTDRRALAVLAGGHYFVGPDNGILEFALVNSSAKIHAITDARLFRQPVSRTFHGRDVFAPVAARLACAPALDSVGPPVSDPIRLSIPPLAFRNGEVCGRVVVVDRFGNALTNITSRALAQAFPNRDEAMLEVHFRTRRIRGISRTYGDAPIGTLVAIVGSSGRLEIAQVGGHAASRVGIGEGDPVTVRAEN